MRKSEHKSLPFFGVGKLRPFLKKYRVELVVMVICGLIGSCMDIFTPLFQRYALDTFIGSGSLSSLPVFIGVYLLTILLTAGANYLCCMRAMKVEVGMDMDMRNAAFSHLQTLSFSYFNQNSVGYIHARVISDTSRIGALVSWTLMDTVWNFSFIIGAVVVMFSINASLALPITLIIPLIVVLFSLFQGKLIRVNREVREINSRITGSFNQGITGAKTIKSLVIEQTVENEFTAETEQYRSKVVKTAHLQGAFAATMHLASSLALAIVLWRGGVLAEHQVGTFSMFMSYAMGMMEPVRWVVDAISSLITTQVNIERYSKLLETQSDVTDTEAVTAVYGDCFEPKTENWEPLRGDIEFRDVSFKYPDGDEYILEHFDLNIPFGTNVAIVGETGAGKSTLVNLVCRFYEPSAGAVLVDGRDLRERSQLWLHSGIGYVLQTPQLFSGTVRQNLLYANPDATDAEIDAALELVSARDVVDRLESGLDTDVGEGGDMLSTGEKQLISFARAILAKPKILVLDEATASVDTITEQKIQAAIDKVIRGRTSIVIAHRLSTVRGADIILVVNDGKIVERGKHEELMAARGAYYRLYTRQFAEESVQSILG